MTVSLQYMVCSSTSLPRVRCVSCACHVHVNFLDTVRFAYQRGTIKKRCAGIYFHMSILTLHALNSLNRPKTSTYLLATFPAFLKFQNLANLGGSFCWIIYRDDHWRSGSYSPAPLSINQAYRLAMVMAPNAAVSVNQQ